MNKVKEFFRWLSDELDPSKSWTQAFIQGCLCILYLATWPENANWVIGLGAICLGAFLYRGIAVKLIQHSREEELKKLYLLGYADGTKDLANSVLGICKQYQEEYERETVPETPMSKEETNVTTSK